MYIRNAWYMAGWSRDVPAAAPTALRMLDQPLVLYRRLVDKLMKEEAAA